MTRGLIVKDESATEQKGQTVGKRVQNKLKAGSDMMSKFMNRPAFGPTVAILGLFIIVCLIYAAVYIPNHWNNDKTVVEKGCTTYSHATQLMGHIEYSVCDDGSVYIKEYPGFGHRLLDSVTYEDTTGDGSIDRIRKSGPEYKVNAFQSYLIRNYVYQENKKEFDEADALLKELKQRYNN